MRRSLLSLAAVTGLLFAVPAQAFDSDWRVKGGMMALEDDDSAAVNAGLVYAMDFVGIIGVEFEANTSITDGEYGPADYSNTQLGGYATLTTPGPIYFKAKAGLTRSDVDIGGTSDSGVGEAIGVGAGFFGLEVEYTRSRVEFEGEDLDIDFLSVSYGF